MGKDSGFVVVPRETVERLYSMKDAIESQERAFRALGERRAWVLPIVHHDVADYSGHLEVKPGVVVGEPALFGLKLISLYPGNERSGLSPLQAVVIINDAATGAPIAIVDGVHLTNFRTAAAGAVGARHLARRGSKRVGVLGTGIQGRLQVAALMEVFEVESVKAWSPKRPSRRRYAKEMGGELGVPVSAMDSARDCVRGVDILVTATPSRTPLVMKDWLEAGMHINVIGADRRGKQELDTAIYDVAKLYVDKREVAVEKGLIKPGQVCGEIGEVIVGAKKGRESEEEITVFDSTGIGVQDVVAAEMVYRRARTKGLGYRVSLSTWRGRHR